MLAWPTNFTTLSIIILCISTRSCGFFRFDMTMATQKQSFYIHERRPRQRQPYPLEKNLLSTRTDLCGCLWLGFCGLLLCVDSMQRDATRHLTNQKLSQRPNYVPNCRVHTYVLREFSFYHSAYSGRSPHAQRVAAGSEAMEKARWLILTFWTQFWILLETMGCWRVPWFGWNVCFFFFFLLVFAIHFFRLSQTWVWSWLMRRNLCETFNFWFMCVHVDFDILGVEVLYERLFRGEVMELIFVVRCRNHVPSHKDG